MNDTFIKTGLASAQIAVCSSQLFDDFLHLEQNELITDSCQPQKRGFRWRELYINGQEHSLQQTRQNRNNFGGMSHFEIILILLISRCVKAQRCFGQRFITFTSLKIYHRSRVVLSSGVKSWCVVYCLWRLVIVAEESNISRALLYRFLTFYGMYEYMLKQPELETFFNEL